MTKLLYDIVSFSRRNFIGHFSRLKQSHNDSSWSLMHSEAPNLCFFIYISHEYFRPQDCIKHWRKEIYIINKQRLKGRQNFHFHLNFLLLLQLGWKLVSRQAGQSTAHKWQSQKTSEKKLDGLFASLHQLFSGQFYRVKMNWNKHIICNKLFGCSNNF